MSHDSPELSYLVDETRIFEKQNLTIRNSTELRDHVGIVGASLDCISTVLHLHHHNGEDELIVHRLSVRCFNSGAASLNLILRGYYQPGLSMIRDVIETTFLLDLFYRDRKALTEWRTLSAKDRERQFSPIQVRMRLDDMDGYQEENRKAAYKMLSTYASHPSPEGFTIISPNNMTQIGPFPDERILTACLQELSKHLAYSTIVFCNHVDSDHLATLNAISKHTDTLERWREKYLSTKTA